MFAVAKINKRNCNKRFTKAKKKQYHLEFLNILVQ